jgi:hypothetical protein
MQGEIGEIFAHAARLKTLHGGPLHMSAPLGPGDQLLRR